MAKIYTAFNKEEANFNYSIFSHYIDSMLRVIKDNKDLSAFCNIVIKNDKFCIDAENLSKEDRELFHDFLRE